MIKVLLALSAYALIAIATFGWSASDPDMVCMGWETENGDVVRVRTKCFPGERFLTGTTAAFAWPFYWSWEIAEAIRGGDHA